MINPLRKWRETNELSVNEAARRVKVTVAMWSRWENGARRVPAERVLDIEKITGVSRHLLRVDVFGPTPDGVAEMEAAE